MSCTDESIGNRELIFFSCACMHSLSLIHFHFASNISILYLSQYQCHINDVLVKLSCELDGLARNVARNKSVANGFGLNVDINPHYS